MDKYKITLVLSNPGFEGIASTSVINNGQMTRVPVKPR